MARDDQRSIRTANAEFQLLRALLSNRNKRHRQRRFLVHGVRSIDLAVKEAWPLEALLVSERASSRWADELVERCGRAGVAIVRVESGLLDELSERVDGSEIVAVARTVDRVVREVGDFDGPVIVAEAIKSPGNLGMILRSADALGAAGVVVTGHTADPYDPQCVRASTGAVFVVPFASAPSVSRVREVLDRRMVGLHPDGEVIDNVDLDGPLVLVAGTESSGLSHPALEVCDALASIPMAGNTASLNVGAAVAVVLAEVARRARNGRAS